MFDQGLDRRASAVWCIDGVDVTELSRISSILPARANAAGKGAAAGAFSA
jgi:hypothetical protein